MDSNPFDQFDDPSQASGSAPPSGSGVTITPAPVPPPAAPAGNIFDQFDDPAHPGNQASASATQPSIGTLVEAPAVGFNRGAADIAGAPVDFVNWGMGKLGLPTSNAPFMGSNYLKQSMGLIGANPDQHPPLTPAERALQGAGEGAASVMVPEAGVGALGEDLTAYAPKTADFLGSTFGAAKSTPAALTNAGVGAASGFGSTVAGELPVPDQWKSLAQMGGGLLGGGIGAAGAAIPTLARQGINAAGDFIAPMTESGQQGIAGARLASAAGGKDALLNSIEENPGSLVPGSVPTLAEQVQIPGVSALQHEIETKNGVPFQDRRATQNQARVSVLAGIQPTGAPEDVASFLRAQLADLDQRAEGIVTQRTGEAQAATGALGGVQSPEFYGAQISGQIQPQIDAATTAARNANLGLGEYGTPEGFGAALRNPAEAAAAVAKQQKNDLYNVIDPNNSLNAVAAPLRQSGIQLQRSINPLAQPPSGEEAAILQTVGSLPDVVPFNSLRALDGRITAAMAQERQTAGESPSWARLVQLKNATQDAIQNGVANQIAYERQQVARGEIAPEQTMEARLRQAWNVPNVARNASGDVGGYRAGNFGASGFGSSPASRSSGANVSPGRGFGEASGAPGIPPSPLVPNFDQTAADRLAAANQANAAFKQTFRQGPVGNMLRTNGFAGQYKLIDSGVPDTVFAKGQGGYEKAMAYRKAVGDAPSAVNALQNYAAMTLRRVAERPDGTIDPAKFSAWKSAYQDALRAVPELKPQFATVQRATDALQRFAPFRADLAPSAIPEMFFHSGPSGADGVRQLRGLLGDQQANSILTDYAASRLKQAAMRPDGTLDPAKTTTWLKQHTDALGAMPGLADRFSTVAKASDAIADAAAARKAATDAYQQGAIGKLLKVSDPTDVTRTIGGIFGQKNAIGEFKRLAAAASKDPDATQGLRKAIVDHVYNSFVGNTENLKSDVFQTFLRKNRTALETVFTPEEVSNMGAIATDLARQKVAFDQGRIPGQSTTAPDLAAAKRAEEGSGHGHGHGVLGALGHGSSLLGKMALAGYAGWEAGEGKGAVLGALGALGSHVVGAMRGAGLTKADDLVKEALLNKTGDGALAKALLMRAPAKPNVGSEVSLGHQLRRIAVLAGTQQGLQ